MTSAGYVSCWVLWFVQQQEKDATTLSREMSSHTWASSHITNQRDTPALMCYTPLVVNIPPIKYAHLISYVTPPGRQTNQRHRHSLLCYTSPPLPIPTLWSNQSNTYTWFVVLHTPLVGVAIKYIDLVCGVTYPLLPNKTMKKPSG